MYIQNITSNAHLAYVSDSPEKEAAQELATDLDNIYQLLESLKNNPSEATEPAFLSQLVTFITDTTDDYSVTYQQKIIAPSDLISMYRGFQMLLDTTKSPSSQITFQWAIDEARQGNTKDLSDFLQELTKDPGAMKNFMDFTSKSAEAFQKYANSH